MAAALARRHRSFGELARGVDPLDLLYRLLFPNGMEITGYVSNRSRRDPVERYAVMAIRPDTGDGREWPFPAQCTFAAIGSWDTQHPAPLFRINGLIETAALPARPFERPVRAFVVHDSLRPAPGQRLNRIDNVLSPQLLAGLPSISVESESQLEGWTDFLAWKRKLIAHKTRGLRYIGREWRDDQLVFNLVSESERALKEAYQSLRRQDVVAFGAAISEHTWDFRVPDQERARDRTLARIELGQPQTLKAVTPFRSALPDCEWTAPVCVDLTVPFSEEDLYELDRADTPEAARRQMLERIPEQGFLSVSTAGDVMLLNRHQKALTQLREQGGYAPYLTSYLFEAAQANVPERLEGVNQWYRKDLNQAQREAVVKILSAPDLCLIQGPPGTGKTTVIAEAITQLVERGQRVLLASQAHTAVDNALGRLGHHGSLRVARIARFVDKVSDDGKPFVGKAALARYYESLAKHAENNWLAAWQRNETDLRCLQDWLARATYVSRDEQELAELQAAMTQQLHDAGRRIETESERYREACDTRETMLATQQRLHAIRAFLDGESDTLPRSLHDVTPVANRVANAMVLLAQAGLTMRYSDDDWKADPGSRGGMLAEMVGVWRCFLARQDAIEADVRRLSAAGDGPMLDAATRLRIEECRREVEELAQRMETDGSYVSRWQAKRQEQKALERAGAGLDHARYRDLFAEGESWCAPVAHAGRLAQKLSVALARIARARPDVERSLAELRLEVDATGSRLAISEPDERPVQEAHERRRRIALELQRLDERHARLHEQIALLLADEAVTKGDRLPLDPAASLAQRIGSATDVVAALERRREADEPERKIWTPLLTEWVRDLRRENAAATDWQDFGVDFLESCNVVAITCNEQEKSLEDIGQASFDVAIIDEVSKATPLEMLLPLMRARRAVLVGDHRQLPPLFQEGDDARTFTDVLDDAEAAGEDERSLLTRSNLRRFEKMVTASLFKSHFERADDAIRARLNVQFRMHPQIMSLVNRFYERQLECGLAAPYVDREHALKLAGVDGQPLLTRDDHVLWVDTTYDLKGDIHREDMEGDQPLRTNRLEAELIAETLDQFDRQCADQGYSRAHPLKVGVVSFYARQCRVIRDAIRRRRPEGRFNCLDVEVNTVIRYQGKEKPIVLVSLVRHDGFDPARAGGQPRRRSSKANVARFEFINVALSRAQSLLVVFGARSMYESYAVDLPHMDREGSESRTVYKDMLDQLDRDGRLVPARRLLAAERMPESPQKRRAHTFRGVRN